MNTEQISAAFLVGLIVFGFIYLPGVQYLVSLAISGVAYGITESLETTVVVLLLSNIFLSMILYNQVLAMAKMEGFVGGNPVEISKRIVKMRRAGGLGGVSDVAEGFEDANQTDMTLSNPEKKVEATPATATSQPAGANAADATAQMTAMMNGLKGLTAAMPQAGGTPPAAVPQVGAPAVATPVAPAPPTVSQQPVPVVAPAGPTQPAPAAAQAMPQAAPPAPVPQVNQGFKGDPSGTQDSLFKLGAMPMDAAGGYHIDAGTTVMNALKNLKPDQIKAMTADTKQLVETQKSLMDMLQSFRPIISEGKEMMETFSQMFK